MVFAGDSDLNRKKARDRLNRAERQIRFCRGGSWLGFHAGLKGNFEPRKCGDVRL